jgi:hypothetical protein
LNFLDLFRAADVIEFEFKRMELLNVPGLTYTLRLTSGPVVHVDCHVSVDWSKSRPSPELTVAGEFGNDGEFPATNGGALMPVLLYSTRGF